jgi:knotted carbamoyltransferase YgeW
MNINPKINQLEKLKSDLAGKDYLLTWEKSLDDLKALLYIADILRDMRNKNISPKIFHSGLAVSIFRDNSTRTRFSFAKAANLLGLEVQDMDETKSQIAHGETVRETANMISFMADFIGIRDDMYLGAGNTYMREVAAALEDGFQNGVLPQRPGVINLQCDIDHPTQSMADLQHLVKYFGGIDQLKGKKIAVTWAYSPSYGKPLSVPQGIIGLMSRFGMDIVLAYPEGYNLIPDVVDLAQNQSSQYEGSFRISDSMEDAFNKADIIYPKSWAPYHVMEKRTELLRKNDITGLKELEKQALAENALYKNWTTDDAKVKLTKNGNALYMHPLPADISGLSCEHGEVSNDVFERYRIETYKEAGWKPYIIAAVMFAHKFNKPADALMQLMQDNVKRQKYKSL